MTPQSEPIVVYPWACTVGDRMRGRAYASAVVLKHGYGVDLSVGNGVSAIVYRLRPEGARALGAWLVEHADGAPFAEVRP